MLSPGSWVKSPVSVNLVSYSTSHSTNLKSLSTCVSPFLPVHDSQILLFFRDLIEPKLMGSLPRLGISHGKLSQEHGLWN